VPAADRYTKQHRATVEQRENDRRRLERLFGWRLSVSYQRLRVYYRRWRHLFSFRPTVWADLFGTDPYAAWIREEECTLGSVVNSAEHLATLATQPTASILIPVRNPHLPWLEESITSVLTQSYPYWELWLCTVNSPASIHSILSRYQDQHERVKIVRFPAPDDVAMTLNRALGLANGEFVGLLGQHDTLAPHALYEVVKRVQDNQGDIVYSDEDAIDATGRRSMPFCKPDWSPDLCLSSLYACHFGVYRKRLVEAVGGFRSAYAESVEYDLLLRCTEQSKRVLHVPRILYHKRQFVLRQAQHERFTHPPEGAGTLKNPFTLSLSKGALVQQSASVMHASAKRALSDALSRRGETAVVEDGPVACTFRVRRQVLATPLVSILIPTRDRLNLLRRCLKSIETQTTYRHYEILILDNGSQEPRTLSYLASLSHQVIRDDEPFNFARLNNRLASLARGEHLLLLNNDIEVITPDWLEALLEHSQRQEVGAVGAQLLYADGTVQHAGVVLGMRGVAGHAHKYLPAKRTGYFCFPRLIRNYSAVTAACLMMRKAVYEEVGGMDERLAVTFNDVDLCLRLRARGYLVVYTPYARLYHHEARSRWYQPPQPEEVQYMLDRWGMLLANDPYYNPHLTLAREDFSFVRDRARLLLRNE